MTGTARPLFSGQGAVRVGLPLEAIQEGTASGDGGDLGIVSRVEGVGTDAAESGEIHRVKRSYLHTQSGMQ